MEFLGTIPLPQLSNGRPESPPSEHGGRCESNHSETEILQSTHLGQYLSLVLVKNPVEKCIRWTPEPKVQTNYLCSSMEGNFTDESTDITSTWTSFRSVTWRLRVKLNMAWANDGGDIILYKNGFVRWDGTTETALHQSN